MSIDPNTEPNAIGKEFSIETRLSFIMRENESVPKNTSIVSGAANNGSAKAIFSYLFAIFLNIGCKTICAMIVEGNT